MRLQKLFLQISIFLCLTCFIDTEYIHAVQQDFPVRFGIIDIIFPGQNSKIGQLTGTYNEALLENPKGVFIGLRSHAYSEASLFCIDYEFVISSVGLSSFTLDFHLEEFCAISYTAVTFNYLVTGQNLLFDLKSDLSSYTSSSNATHQILTFQFTTSKVFYYVLKSISTLKTTFLNAILNIKLLSTIQPSRVLIKIQFNLNMDIKKIKVSCFCYYQLPASFKPIYDITYTSLANTNKQYTFAIPISIQHSVLFFLDIYQCYTLTSKFDFTITTPTFYEFKFKQNNSVGAYVQLFRYYVFRKSCANNVDYPYLQSNQQRCHDICPDHKFGNTSKICVLCSTCTNTVNCELCYSNNCDEGYYWTNTTNPFSCILCNTKILNCLQCSANISGVFCTLCDNSTQNYAVKMGGCDICDSNQYYDGGIRCQLCSEKIQDCQECSVDGTTCTSCILASKTQLIAGECVPCNSTSFFDTVTLTCLLCSNNITDCQECSIDSFFIVSCSICSSLFVLQNGICIQSPTSNTCNTHIPYCQKCQNNICLICDSFSQTQLLNGKCYNCDLFSFYNNSESECYTCFYYQDKHIQAKHQCPFLSQTSNIFNTSQFIIAFPTINLLTNVFLQLFATIDDLSYYTYHQIKYFQPLKFIFQLTADLSLARFFPKYVQQTYNSLADKKVIEQQKNSIQQYKDKQQSIYFLNQTLLIWIGNLPLSILTFFIGSFIYWITNKYIYKNSIFKSYSYVGMIIVNLFGGNIQYFSFKCFSNFYENVPYSNIHFLNIIASYLVLFIIIIYSIVGIQLFHVLYSNVKIKYEYIVEELFDYSSNRYFVIYNLFKILTGFIHAYFLFYPFLQCIILFIVYLIKSIFTYNTFGKNPTQRYKFATQFIGQLLFMFLQLLILKQQLIQTNNIQFLSQTGTLQVIIVYLMLINKLLLSIYQLLKQFIESMLRILNKQCKQCYHRNLKYAEFVRVHKQQRIVIKKVIQPKQSLKTQDGKSNRNSIINKIKKHHNKKKIVLQQIQK